MSFSIKIRKPDDFHIHLRDFPEAANYLSFSEDCFARGVVMPNTTLPIDNLDRFFSYREKIVNASKKGFVPLMSFKISSSLSEKDIKEFKKAGALIGKLYPQGVTTNSQDGISSISQQYHIFEKLQEFGIGLSIHGEAINCSPIESERKFLKELEPIIKTFPKLKIIMEHVSTKEAVCFISNQPENVGATITVHHLLFSIEDLLGKSFLPHLFCKPILQSVYDKRAIQQVVLEGNKKFFFGSDSAPHLKEKKECATVAAGIFSAPVALPLLAEFFDSQKSLHRLEDFVSRFGAEFYELPLNNEEIELVKEPWVVAQSYFGVVPLCAGKQISWRVKCS